MHRLLWCTTCSLALLSLVGSGSAYAQRLFPLQQVTFSNGGGSAADTLTVSDASGSGIPAHYPLQFGRPFVEGAIPAGQCPVASISDSPPLATQVDVKNVYPDGSVKYAVMAVGMPAVAANGSVTLNIAAGACPSSTPLTQAQMLDPSYGFDAIESLAFPAMLIGGPQLGVAATAQFANVQAVTSGGFTFTDGPATVPVAGLNFSTIGGWGDIATVLANGINAALPAGAPAVDVQIGYSLTSGGNTPIVQLLSPSGAAISLASAPASGTDITAMFGLTAATGAQVYGASTATASARTMLSNGDYKLWTSGPVAQTILLGDDSTAAKYDLGFGDGHRPFRPRFEATFYPATHQVQVRFVGENDKSTELEGLSYNLTLSTGTTPQSVYSLDLTGGPTGTGKVDWPGTAWTKTFWLGGTPNPQVNIDNNIAYLASTRFIPNFDPAAMPTAADVTASATAWLGVPHDLYDGQWDGGLWHSYMGDPGNRPEIAPYPQWSAMWLYTGNWQMRQVALTMADLAGAWPEQFRETDPTRRLSRTDATGANPETGLGHVVSITDRKTMLSALGYLWYGAAGDHMTQVGPYTTTPWVVETSHIGDMFYPQYLLTGDPWYLQEMYFADGYAAASYPGDAAPYSYGRGPTGDEGGIADELRGAGFVLRNRAEDAFIAPDADPEKAYFTYLTNDALARWEGGFQITGTVFDGSPIKVWGASVGNHYDDNGGSVSQTPPLLHNWESTCQPQANPVCPDLANDSTFAADANGQRISTTYTTPWMEWYVRYALGRAGELGFAAGPLRSWSIQYLTGMINDSGNPLMISTYQFPVEANPTTNPYGSNPAGGFLSWPQIVNGPPSALSQAFQTGNGWNPALGATLPQYFAGNLTDDGRPIYAQGGLAMSVDAGDPGASQAWTWFQPNVHQAIPAAVLQADPKWDIIPRTDNNALPAMPTVIPPS